LHDRIGKAQRRANKASRAGLGKQDAPGRTNVSGRAYSAVAFALERVEGARIALHRGGVPDAGTIVAWDVKEINNDAQLVRVDIQYSRGDTLTWWTYDGVELGGAKISIGTRTLTFRRDRPSGTEEAIEAPLRSTKVLRHGYLGTDACSAVVPNGTRERCFRKNILRPSGAYQTITLEFGRISRSRRPHSRWRPCGVGPAAGGGDK